MDDIITPPARGTPRVVGQVQTFRPGKAVVEEGDEKASKAFENRNRPQKKAPKVDAAKLAEEANKRVKLFNTRIQFKYDEEDKRSIIIVTDKETGEVIRQIPPKEMVSLMDKMEEIEGIIFNRSI